MITATVITLVFAPIALTLFSGRGRRVDARQPFPCSTLRDSLAAGLGL